MLALAALRPHEPGTADRLTGTLLVALAVTLFQHAGLLSGGTAGVAFLAHYLGSWSFGVVYFLINLPFYGIAWRQMGRGFALRTLAAVALVSVLADWLPQHLALASLDPWLAAILGGVLMGNGFLVLFRHRASLGGLGIVALVSVPLERVALSIGAVVVLNLVIATDHRPGRYVAR